MSSIKEKSSLLKIESPYPIAKSHCIKMILLFKNKEKLDQIMYIAIASISVFTTLLVNNSNNDDNNNDDNNNDDNNNDDNNNDDNNKQKNRQTN